MNRRNRNSRRHRHAPLRPPVPLPNSPRSPAKLRAKIRLRPAKMEDGGQRSLPAARMGLGERRPVFRPAALADPTPDWEGVRHVVSSQNRLLTIGFSLLMLTSVVAGMVLLPGRSPTKPDVAVIEVPVSLLETFQQLLAKESTDEKLAFAWRPKSTVVAMERYFESQPRRVPWFEEGPSLSDMPHQLRMIEDTPRCWELTVWPHDNFPVSIVLHDSLEHPKFDWASLVGMGEQALDTFFLQRPSKPVELRVMVSAVAESTGVWRLSKEDHLRVRMSDLEGLVNGIAYLDKKTLPAWLETRLQNTASSDRTRVTLKAHYIESANSRIRVPIISEWVAADWRTRLEP